jgi:hypothetical protein
MGDLFALKIRSIETETQKVVSWIEEFYLMEGKYPKKFEEVLYKEFKVFDYDISKYYKNLEKEGYHICINEETLVIMNINDMRRCIYNFQNKKCLLYENQRLIKIFYLNS